MSDQMQGIPDVTGLATEQTSQAIAGLIRLPYDTIQITAFADATEKYPTTVLYRSGGAAGTIVATLTMSYDGSNRLIQVVKT